MGSRTEKDYDSATPALQQQMNLARRACWTRLWPSEPSSRANSTTRVPSLSPNPNSSNGAIQMRLASQAANPIMQLEQSEAMLPEDVQRLRRQFHCRQGQMATPIPRVLWLLCGLCMLLACSEARPNVSASSSTVSSSARSATTSSAGPTDAVTQLNVSVLMVMTILSIDLNSVASSSTPNTSTYPAL